MTAIADELEQRYRTAELAPEHVLRRAVAELRLLRQERDCAVGTLRDEMDENLRWMQEGEARPGENITAFLERMIRERREFRDLYAKTYAELGAISGALGGDAYWMDPPDGGNVSIAEQVARANEAGRAWHAAPRWIACSERMPDAGVEVLVWLADPAVEGSSNIVMDTWDEQYESPVMWSSATIPIGMGWDSGAEWEGITHWMPLPAPPKEEA